MHACAGPKQPLHEGTLTNATLWHYGEGTCVMWSGSDARGSRDPFFALARRRRHQGKLARRRSMLVPGQAIAAHSRLRPPNCPCQIPSRTRESQTCRERKVKASACFAGRTGPSQPPDAAGSSALQADALPRLHAHASRPTLERLRRCRKTLRSAVSVASRRPWLRHNKPRARTSG